MKHVMICVLLSLAASTAYAAPDLTVDISGPAQATVGAANQAYSVAVGNIGNQSMPRVTLRVTLPNDLQLVSYASPCQLRTGPRRLECVYYTHNAGTSRSFGFVAAAPTAPGSWSFTASVTGSKSENSSLNNSDVHATQLVAPAVVAPIPIVPTQTVHGFVCWDPAQTVDNCAPYAIDEQVFDLVAQNQVITGDPNVEGAWFQSSTQDDLQLFFYDATSGELLVEMNTRAASATCFEGTAVYTVASPSTYNVRICL